MRRAGRLLVVIVGLVLLLGALASCSKEEGTQKALDPAELSGEASLTVTGKEETGASPTAGDDAAGPIVPTPTATAEPPPAPLAAMVNGRYIFLEDYERQVAMYQRVLQDQGLDLESDEGEAEMELLRIDVLEAMIDSELMREEAERLGLTLTGEELEEQLALDIEEGGGEAAFAEWLEATGQTKDDYAQMLYDLLLSDRILDIVADSLPEVAEQVHIRHIAVSGESEAQEVVSELAQGADFAELARSLSEDTLTGEEGGDLGWFPAGVIAPELESVAFSLEVGETSGVIEVGDGYHVIQVLEREAERPISEELKMDLELATFERWLEGLRAAAAIERYVGE